MTQQLNTASSVPQWTLGDRLRKAREITGLDAGQFAEEIGIARNTVGNYEHGRVETRRVVLNAWALRTGVPIEWLMTGQAPPTPNGGLEVGPGPADTPKSSQRNTRGFAAALVAA